MDRSRDARGRNSKAWGKHFNAYLWADLDERTQKTAAALATGLEGSGVSVTVGTLYSATVDPLFHPYQANCGTPDPAELNPIVANIKAKCGQWIGSYMNQFKKLDYVLGCQNSCPSPIPNTTPRPAACEPLSCLEKTACSPSPAPKPSPTPTATPTRTARDSSPIKWDGAFSYASSATEAFLLEYANDMPTGWGRVKVGQPDDDATVSELLRLHEFYFDITERDPYLAGLGGANLVREIFLQLNRKADGMLPIGTCPRGDVNDQFVGLVGHDTNLANLNKLLNVEWKFINSELPDDTRNLPDNDALPAGALVFELRGDKSNYRVRIQYVTQSLGQIRSAAQPANAYRIHTTCGGCSPCEMSLEDFNKLANGVITKFDAFLSKCQGDKQTCP